LILNLSPEEAIREFVEKCSAGGVYMPPIGEADAETLIEEHLRQRGWDLTDFTLTRKQWREHLGGEAADRVFLYDGQVVAILEAKKPGKDLWAALAWIIHRCRERIWAGAEKWV